jgi:hypothetical protein
MITMTDHIEGSSRVHTSIWAKAKDDQISAMEHRAFRKARREGAPKAVIKNSTVWVRLALEARGWELESTVSVGIATNTRFVLTKALGPSAES